MENPLEPPNKACARLGIKPAERMLVVRLGAQTLQFYRGGVLALAYPVSTSLRPPSNVRNSLGTPRGLHDIAERVGGGQPPGMVFKARVPTGRHFSEFSEEENRANLVTTRILWLRGLEPGVNLGGEMDTHSRYIYLHGTNHEDKIGQPCSAGCVLLRNLDIIALHDEVRVGDMVWIGE
jgi:hypothetical protein